MEEKYQKVSRNLNTLAVLQYVWAGLSFFSAIIIFIVYFILGTAFTSDVFPVSNADDQAVFQVIGGVFFIISIISVIILIATAVMKIMCGVFIQKKKNRIFCIVIAALECFNIPFGTALGVFTIVELEKPEAKEMFEHNKV